jgi:tRNA/rRNA methyltransferase
VDQNDTPQAVSETVTAAQPGDAATRFVLVEPSHPGNIGAAARALKTMGFSRLILVRPRRAGVLQDPEAIAMASGADDVLAAAQCVQTLEQALLGVHWSVALSARTREYGPPVLTPRAAAQAAARMLVPPQARDDATCVALVFGNERTGLANQDVERCSAIAHIPANPAYTSLNLAQAVQVLAYELRVAYADLPSGAPALADAVPAAMSAAIPSEARASSDEIEGMFAHLEQALTALDFFDPANPKKLQSRLRRLFARTGLEREEVNILRGIAKHILLKIKS